MQAVTRRNIFVIPVVGCNAPISTIHIRSNLNAEAISELTEMIPPSCDNDFIQSQPGDMIPTIAFHKINKEN